MVTERQVAARAADAPAPGAVAPSAAAPAPGAAAPGVAAPSARAPRSERIGWLMVGLVFVVLSTMNGLVFYSMSAYLDALVQERGFDVTLASSGPAVSAIAGAISGLMVARLVARRASTRLILIVGAIGTAIGLVAIGHATQSWQLWLAFAIFGSSSSATTGVPCSTLVARWFPDSPARPLAIAMSGLSAGGAFIPPVTLALIDGHGLMVASQMIAVGVLVIVGTVAVFIREAPVPAVIAASAGTADKTAGSSADATGRRSAAASVATGKLTYDRRFWLLTVGFAVIMLSQLGTGTHLVRLAREEGIKGAAAAISAMAICSLAGRLSSIPVLPMLGLRRFTIVLGILQVCAIATLATAQSQIHLVIGAAMLGATTGNFIFMSSLYCIEAYGLELYPRMYARVNLASPVGSGSGPLIIGMLVAAFGSYRAPLLLMCLVSAAGVTALVASGVDSARRPRRAGRPGGDGRPPGAARPPGAHRRTVTQATQ